MFFSIIFLLTLITTFLIRIFVFKIKKFEIEILIIDVIFTLIITCCTYYALVSNKFHDIEILNGIVQSKKQVKVSCDHNYKCMCYESCQDLNGHKSCTEYCSTCYEHDYDYNWNVYTTLGIIPIHRIDRQGVKQPERFRMVEIGEAVALHHEYDNYVKASQATLFKTFGDYEKYEKELPNYPDQVYDYYRVERFVTTNFSVDNFVDFSQRLNMLNGRIGHLKQVNVIVVMTQNRNHDWFYALREKWVGAKKNDVVVVVNVDNALKPIWVDVMSWTDSKILNITIRDDIMNLQHINPDSLMNIIESRIVLHYVRKPFKDFEYLKNSVHLSTIELFVTSLLIILLSFGNQFLISKIRVR